MSEPFDIIGTTGLKVQSGKVTEEFLPRLRGQKAAKTYREMRDNDATVGAIIYAFDTLVRSVNWSIIPASDSTQAVEQSAFIQSVLDDMSHTWEDFLSEVFSMIVYGWSYFELVYKTRRKENSRFDDGKVGLSKISIRGQETLDGWEFDDDGGVQGMWQMPPQGSRVFLPIEKCLLFRTSTHKNNPEGRSVLRNAVRAWYFLKRLQEFEAIGFQRNLAGFPLLKVPPKVMEQNASGAFQSQRNEFEKIVQEIGVDERAGLVMPASKIDGKETGYDFSLIASPNVDRGAIRQAIVAYQGDIARSVNADFILMAGNNVGSSALAKSRTSLFGLTLSSLLDGVQAVVNRFMVPRLMELNNVDESLWPEFRHGQVNVHDLQDTVEFISRLGTHGFMKPTPEIEEELLRRANLPTERNQVSEITSPEKLPFMLQVVQAVHSGQIPKEAGLEMLMSAFPMSEEKARLLIEPGEMAATNNEE